MLDYPSMVFAFRLYSSSQVKKEGETLRATNPLSEKYQEALNILLNFRAIHAYPLNTFQATLRQRLSKISKTAIIAQKIKRLPTILDKLLRIPHMQLNRMQDIGGLRAIVNTPSELEKIYTSYKNAQHFPHQLAEEKDYITTPKKSGYRGRHLIYKNINHTLNIMAYVLKSN